MQSTVGTSNLENIIKNSAVSEASIDFGVQEDSVQTTHSSNSSVETHSIEDVRDHEQGVTVENHEVINCKMAESKGNGDSRIVGRPDENVLLERKDVYISEKEAGETDREQHCRTSDEEKDSSTGNKDTDSGEGSSEVQIIGTVEEHGNKVGSSEEKIEAEKGNEQNSVSEIDGSTNAEEWLDILGSGQLRKKVLRKAENSYRPQNLQLCEVNIEGWLEDGTVVERYTNFKLQLGDLEVVQGLDLGLPLMDIGEEALLEVGPRFAYGDVGRSSDIPPNATITYKVELLSAENEPDLYDLAVTERSEIGNKKRERGNWWYERENYTAAIQCYRRAMEYLDELDTRIDIGAETKKEEITESELCLLEDRLKVFNNLAAAQMKIKSFDTALESVEKVLTCQPKNVKALFRKGKILAAKGETTVAIAVLRQASQLEPESKTIKQELLRLQNQNKRETKMEKNLYKRMLGQDKNTETRSSKPSKFYQVRWGVVFGSIAAMVAGMVAYRYKFL